MANASLIVSAALASLANGNVFPVINPDTSVRPFIVYTPVGGQDYSGLSGGGSTLRNTRMQVVVWANTFAETQSIGDAIYAALTGPSVGAVPIGAPSSTYEEDTRLHGSSQDFSITFRIT